MSRNDNTGPEDGSRRETTSVGADQDASSSISADAPPSGFVEEADDDDDETMHAARLRRMLKSDSAAAAEPEVLAELLSLREEGGAEWLRCREVLKEFEILGEIERLLTESARGSRKRATIREQAQDDASTAETEAIKDLRIDDDAIYRRQEGTETRAAGWRPITNFGAWLDYIVEFDDGVERQVSLQLRVVVNGRRYEIGLTQAELHEFAWDSRLTHLGCWVEVGEQPYARLAIIKLSQPETKLIVTHTGWRVHDGKRVFCHAGGALGAEGAVAGIETDLPPELSWVRLPEPPRADARARLVDKAVDALLRAAPLHITATMLSAMVSTAMGVSIGTVALVGPSGCGKTSLGAASVSMFGAVTPDQLLSWSSTSNAIESLLDAGKDVTLILDDFAPTTDEARRLAAIGERVIRNQSNRAGRARMRADGKLRRTKVPRGGLFVTAEDLFGQGSLRARQIVLQMSADTVDFGELTKLQELARSGELASYCADLVCWLARESDVRARHASVVQKQRQRLRASLPSAHPRTIETISRLIAAASVASAHLIDAKAMTEREAEIWLRRCGEALERAATEQHVAQEDVDPAQALVRMLRAILAAGHAHVADPHGGEPTLPSACGWRKRDDKWQPCGSCLGWLVVGDRELLLNPDEVTRAAENYGRPYGAALSRSATTLGRMLRSRGVLKQSDEGHTTARRTVGGRIERVWVLDIAVLEREEPPARGDAT